MLVCIVTVEMMRPTDDPEAPWRWQRWKRQREHGDTDSLDPPPNGEMRVWRGSPEARDWDRLVRIKELDGWHTVSHRREFVNVKDERTDRVSL